MENIIINCYRLAEKYHCDPDVFLRKKISQVGRDLYWSDRMNESENIETRWQEKLRNN
jgi:hypothetical protein